MKLKGKKDYEKLIFLILLAAMALYYGWRMFCLTPWYDELYTYYYFISKGPVYAAIHWPLPNNHVGYSVLSGFLNYLGNPYIGLRGISYLCALGNMCLLFGIARKYFERWIPVITVVLYISMNLVNQLAVQGRGYTLGITCYLTAIHFLIKIDEDEKSQIIYYTGFAAALVLGLYTITSNVYWVASVCLTGGFYLLYKGSCEARQTSQPLFKTKYIRKLIKLIAASLLAALVTVGLYCIIWLAIGSNLLVKDADSVYYGLGHAAMILKSPFDAAAAGIDYMLSMPYIQSVERTGFLLQLCEWLKTLADYYYGGISTGVLAIIGISIPYTIVKIIVQIKKKQCGNMLIYIFLLTGFLFVPFILMIQSTLPYYRVFAFGGVLLSMALACFVQEVVRYIKNPASVVVPAILAAALGIKCFFFLDYNNQYSMREYYLQDGLEEAKISEASKLCVTDCTQQYLLYFLYGIRCENQQIEGSEIVLLDKRMTDASYQEMQWEFYHYYNTIPWEYIEKEMKQVYENQDFILYKINNEAAASGRMEGK